LLQTKILFASGDYAVSKSRPAPDDGRRRDRRAGRRHRRRDAPVIRGEHPAPPPVLLDWERPLFERNSPQAGGLTGPPCAVDRELEDGDVIDFGGGATILAIPGHTDPFTRDAGKKLRAAA
jgi:glyoxylase-like metal-dependent hydrolase (beta-lactamase superfamily II)